MNKSLVIRLLTIIFFVTKVAFTEPLSLQNFRNRPNLILFIVIDQFRADYLTRFQERFLPNKKQTLGGFQYLLETGAWFPQGRFEILQNMTGPGHATLLTGAYPYANGIPINEWYSSEKSQPIYCVEDSSFEWFSGKSKDHVGTSPQNLRATTVGDELKFIRKNSKVVSISLKDRSAILMGGHRADAAVWMDPTHLQWTSTRFYFPDGQLPSWIQTVNQTLIQKRNELVNPKGAAKISFFPQGLTWGEKAIQGTPTGLALTETLLENAVNELKMGTGKDTDLLAVSFSSHDYAGHTYGPTGPAMEEMTLADDAILSKLFNFLNKKIPGGMDKVLVVLTADHGVAPNPESVKMAKIDAGRIVEDSIKDQINKALTEKFGKVANGWILKIKEMNLYLNPRAIVEKKLAPQSVEDEVKSELMKVNGIAYAFSRSDYDARKLPPGIFTQQILNSYVPERSGDVVGILKPFFISSDDTANHQTGYSYDKTVPILFAGPNIKRGVFATAVETVDIAPTLAFILGTVPPTLSQGRVLSEIFGKTDDKGTKKH